VILQGSTTSPARWLGAPRSKRISILTGNLSREGIEEDLQAGRIRCRHDKRNARPVLWSDRAVHIDVFANEPRGEPGRRGGEAPFPAMGRGRGCPPAVPMSWLVPVFSNRVLNSPSRKPEPEAILAACIGKCKKIVVKVTTQKQAIVSRLRPCREVHPRMFATQRERRKFRRSCLSLSESPLYWSTTAFCLGCNRAVIRPTEL
jgi:hypothetical protein